MTGYLRQKHNVAFAEKKGRRGFIYGICTIEHKEKQHQEQ